MQMAFIKNNFGLKKKSWEWEQKERSFVCDNRLDQQRITFEKKRQMTEIY